MKHLYQSSIQGVKTMIEYIKIQSIIGLGDVTEIEIYINGNTLNYKYSSRGLSAAEKSGKTENLQGFIRKIEAINVYSFKNRYYYENILIEDGLDFSIHYKECGKSEKEIRGQYYPDEVIELFSAIEELIPEALFFDKVDFDEWYEEIAEEMELSDVDESVIIKLKTDFDRETTWAKKNAVLEEAIDLLEPYSNQVSGG